MSTTRRITRDLIFLLFWEPFWFLLFNILKRLIFSIHHFIQLFLLTNLINARISAIFRCYEKDSLYLNWNSFESMRRLTGSTKFIDVVMICDHCRFICRSVTLLQSGRRRLIIICLQVWRIFNFSFRIERSHCIYTIQNLIMLFNQVLFGRHFGSHTDQ